MPEVASVLFGREDIRRRVRELEGSPKAGEMPVAETFPPASHPPFPKDDPTLPL